MMNEKISKVFSESWNNGLWTSRSSLQFKIEITYQSELCYCVWFEFWCSIYAVNNSIKALYLFVYFSVKAFELVKNFFTVDQLVSTQTFFKISRAWPFAHMVKCPLKKGLFFKFFDFSNFKMFPTKTGMVWSRSFLVCNKYLPILVSINSIEMIRYNVTGLEGIKYCKNVKNRLKWHILVIYSKD